MKIMSALEAAKARVDQLLCGTLPAVYADNNTLTTDIVLLTKEYGHLGHWVQPLDRAQRMLTGKITRDAAARISAERKAWIDTRNADLAAKAKREQDKRARHARNLNDRRERQRLEAAGAGSGSKKGRNN